MIGHEAARRWTGIPLMTLLSFASLGGLSERARPTAADGLPPLVQRARYCRPVTAGVAECAFFEGVGAAPDRLRDVELVIGERGFEALPPREKPCWRRLPSGEYARKPAQRNTALANETSPPIGSAACP